MPRIFGMLVIPINVNCSIYFNVHASCIYTYVLYYVPYILQVSLNSSTQSSVLWGADDVPLAERLKVSVSIFHLSHT